MKSQITKSILFVSILLISAYFVNNQLLKGLRLLETGDFGVWNKVTRGEVNSQILIIGSSRALVNFDCDAIIPIVNKTCFNIGLNGVQPYLQLPMLKSYLKHNKYPELIIQDLDIKSLLNPGPDIFSPEKYIPYLDDKDIYSKLYMLDNDFWLNKYIPLYSFGKYGTKLTSPAIKGLFGIKLGLSPIFKNGFERVDLIWKNDFNKFKKAFPNGITYPLYPNSIKDLEDIISLAKSKKIKLILVYPPEYYENINLTKNRNEIFDIFKKMAAKYGVPFWDFSALPITQSTEYFYNSQHLNGKGAYLFSGIFAEKLKEYLTALN